MVNPYRFYTYAYLREDKTPYYIGKGCGKRVYEKCNREIKPPKDKSRIIFLKKNILEEEAFKHEIYMIAVLGRIDLGTGILRNKTDGGEGSSGVVISKENRRKLSEMWRGENNPNYGKVGEKNPDYGKKWWNDGNGNLKKSFECPGEGWVPGMGEQRKIKLSKRLKGKNNPNYGKPCSEETRRKIREKHIGKAVSKETRRKQSKSGKGKVWWNNGKNNTRSIDCPGEGWVPGIIKKQFQRDT